MALRHWVGQRHLQATGVAGLLVDSSWWDVTGIVKNMGFAKEKSFKFLKYDQAYMITIIVFLLLLHRIPKKSDKRAGTGALLASFMSSMSGGSGQQMLQSARGAHVGSVAAR